MSNNKQTYFKSEVTQLHFGAGISIEMLSREELRKCLSGNGLIDDLKTESLLWTQCVFNNFLNPGMSWSVDTLRDHYIQISDDIKMVKERLIYLTEEKNV